MADHMVERARQAARQADRKVDRLEDLVEAMHLDLVAQSEADHLAPSLEQSDALVQAHNDLDDARRASDVAWDRYLDLKEA